MSFSSFQQCLLDHIYSSNFWSLAVLATWLYLLSPRIIPAMNLTLRQLSMHFPRSRRQYPHLPPELLVVIFVQLQQVDPPHTKKIRSKRKSPRPFRHLYREEFCDLGWLKVLHVCKQWREIAEKSPSLWNDIPNGRLPSIWIQKYLGCSHPLELSLAINMGHYPLVTATSVLDALIRDMHRTRSLTVDAVGAPYILFPHSSMSRLRSLTICGGAGSDSNTPIVPHGLSDPATQPNIESLHLRRCLIPLHGAWTSNLVDLDVRLARGALFNVDLKPLWNLSSVALFLNGLKRLETLRLMYAFPEVQAMDHPEIYFPSSFKALSLCGNLSSGESFLSCLRLPDGATVDIAVRANPFGFPTALHPFLPLHAPAFLTLELSAPTSMTPQMILRTWEEMPPSIIDPLSLSTAERKFTVDSTMLRASHTEIEGIISDIAGCHADLQLNQLRQLLLRVPSAAHLIDEDISTGVWKAFNWKPLLLRTPALQTIYARGQPAALSMVKALLPRSDPDECERSLVCPALAKIVILDVDFLAGMSDDIHSLIPKSMGRHVAFLFDALYACLEKRKDVGSPVQEIELASGHNESPKDGSAPWLRRLRKLVPEVRFVTQKDVWHAGGRFDLYWLGEPGYDEYLSLP